MSTTNSQARFNTLTDKTKQVCEQRRQENINIEVQLLFAQTNFLRYMGSKFL